MSSSELYQPAASILAVYMLRDQEAHAAEISEIVSRFERKEYKLVAIKLVVPSKEFAQKQYHDLKERPFFNGLCDFLSSGPVLACDGLGRRGCYQVREKTNWRYRNLNQEPSGVILLLSLEGTSFMGAMAQRQQRLRLLSGLSLGSWSLTPATRRSGSTG